MKDPEPGFQVSYLCSLSLGNGIDPSDECGVDWKMHACVQLES